VPTRRGGISPGRFGSARPAAALCVAIAALAVVSGGGARTTAAPQNDQAPSVNGSALVGQKLTADRGSWKGTPPISYASAWERCDANGEGCAAIAGATSSTYTVTSADLGARLRVAITATNGDGAATAQSAATAAVTTASGKPASSAPPAITGTPNVGSTLTASTGRWAGDQPISYAYQWQRCDADGNACGALSAQKASTYRAVQDDLGHALRVRVTAKNSRGSSNAISDPTAAVKDAAGGSGIVDIGGGKKSADVGSVTAGERLIVQGVSFDPNPVRSRSRPITVVVTVTDTRGYYVRGAWVFIRSTPVLTQAAEDQQTGPDGKTTFSIMPRADFPLKDGYSVQFYVKAYRKGDNTLAGVAGTRLVQVATAK
jgi:hypothetical protein